MDSESEGTPRKSQVTSLPSDYSDVQPDNYDPDFITQISSKMQVPYTIGAQEGDHHHQAPAENVQYRQHMMVPEKILVAGEGRHVGVKEGLPPLQFDGMYDAHRQNYVGLSTPPRTLTLEETFPYMIQQEGREGEEENISHNHSMSHAIPNGSVHAMQPVPYTPGASLNESFIHTEQDLSTAVAKLTRRVKTLEEESQRKWLSDMILYALVGGTLLKNIIGWIIRSRD